MLPPATPPAVALAAGLFTTAMNWFPYVFHPTTLVGAGLVTLIYYEWNRQPAGRDELRRRLGGFALSGAFALLPTAVYMLATGKGVMETTQGNAWQVDWLVAGGVVVAAVTLWGVWTRYDWGPLVPKAAVALVAATLPYTVASPFWNVSGHVTMALFPALYLTLVDRKFWPTLLVPVLMVPNRLYLDAHTTAEAVGGFLVTTAVVLAVYRIQGTGRSALPRVQREVSAPNAPGERAG